MSRPANPGDPVGIAAVAGEAVLVAAPDEPTTKTDRRLDLYETSLATGIERENVKTSGDIVFRESRDSLCKFWNAQITEAGLLQEHNVVFGENGSATLRLKTTVKLCLGKRGRADACLQHVGLKALGNLQYGPIMLAQSKLLEPESMPYSVSRRKARSTTEL